MSTECCAIREGRGRGKWGVMGVMVMVWVWVWVNKNDLCVLRVIGVQMVWGRENTHHKQTHFTCYQTHSQPPTIVKPGGNMLGDASVIPSLKVTDLTPSLKQEYGKSSPS